MFVLTKTITRYFPLKNPSLIATNMYVLYSPINQMAKLASNMSYIGS